MTLDKKDIEMMSIAIPVVDWWDIRDEIDGLSDAVMRLEKTVEALVELHRQERVKTWEMVLTKMLGNHRRDYDGRREKL